MKKLWLFMTVLSFVFALVPLQSHAAGFVECGVGKLTDPGYRACGLCDVFVLITTVINFFLFPTPQNNGFAVVPILAGLFLTIGGVYMFLGGQSPTYLAQGKRVLTAVVVGLIIVYAAWLFVGFFLQAFGVAQWTGLGTWWQISCQ